MQQQKQSILLYSRTPQKNQSLLSFYKREKESEKTITPFFGYTMNTIFSIDVYTIYQREREIDGEKRGKNWDAGFLCRLERMRVGMHTMHKSFCSWILFVGLFFLSLSLSLTVAFLSFFLFFLLSFSLSVSLTYLLYHSTCQKIH